MAGKARLQHDHLGLRDCNHPETIRSSAAFGCLVFAWQLVDKRLRPGNGLRRSKQRRGTCPRQRGCMGTAGKKRKACRATDGGEPFLSESQPQSFMATAQPIAGWRPDHPVDLRGFSNLGPFQSIETQSEAMPKSNHAAATVQVKAFVPSMARAHPRPHNSSCRSCFPLQGLRKQRQHATMGHQSISRVRTRQCLRSDPKS